MPCHIDITQRDLTMFRRTWSWLQCRQQRYCLLLCRLMNVTWSRNSSSTCRRTSLSLHCCRRRKMQCMYCVWGHLVLEFSNEKPKICWSIENLVNLPVNNSEQFENWTFYSQKDFNRDQLGFNHETGRSIFLGQFYSKNKEKLHNYFLDKIDREYYFYQPYVSLNSLLGLYFGTTPWWGKRVRTGGTCLAC